MSEERGRPSSWTDEAADEILKRLAKGETLRGICRDDHLPAESTVRQWVIDDRNGFSARYARARDMQLESWADECTDIADDGTNDWMERETKKGGVVTTFDHEHALRSKLRVETRKWLLSKLKPEKYGDRVEVHTHKHDDVSPEPEAVTQQKQDEWLDQHGNATGPTIQ